MILSSRLRTTALIAVLALSLAGCGHEKKATQVAAKVNGDEITVQSGPEGIRFLLISGQPLEEPVAWYGPIVMNTQSELQQAMNELQR